MENKSSTNIEWKQAIPLYSRFVIKDILLAFSIPTFIIIIFIGSMALSDLRRGYSVSFEGASYALGLILIVILLTILTLWIVYNNRFQTRFKLDNKGVHTYLIASSRKKSRWINALLLLASLSSKNPTYAGIAMTSQTQEQFFSSWKNIFSYQPYPHLNCIVLRNSWRKVAVLYCNKENFSKVLEVLENYILPQREQKTQELKSIKKERLKNLLYVPPVILSAFFMTAIYEYSFDSKAVVFIIAFWVLLGAIVDLEWKFIFVFLGYVGIGITWIIFSVSFFADALWSYDYPRWLFFTMGTMGMIAILYLQQKRNKTIH